MTSGHVVLDQHDAGVELVADARRSSGANASVSRWATPAVGSSRRRSLASWATRQASSTMRRVPVESSAMGGAANAPSPRKVDLLVGGPAQLARSARRDGGKRRAGDGTSSLALPRLEGDLRPSRAP